MPHFSRWAFSPATMTRSGISSISSGAEQGRRVPLRNENAGRKRQAVRLLARKAPSCSNDGWEMAGRSEMDVPQSFLIRQPVGVNDPHPGRSGPCLSAEGLSGGEGGDVVFQTAAAAGAALVVAGDAGDRVEDRPEPIAARRQRIVRLPLVLEQHLPSPRHFLIDDPGASPVPQQHARPAGTRSQQRGQNVPGPIGLFHKSGPSTATGASGLSICQHILTAMSIKGKTE